MTIAASDCERCRPGPVAQPVNTASSLAYVAAGAALVLSAVEAFPEVFGAAATLLPVVGQYEPSVERRVSPADWAEVIVELMRDAGKWREASRKARALAEQHTWAACVDRWQAMLTTLAGEA